MDGSRAEVPPVTAVDNQAVLVDIDVSFSWSKIWLKLRPLVHTGVHAEFAGPAHQSTISLGRWFLLSGLSRCAPRLRSELSSMIEGGKTLLDAVAQ